MVDGAVQIQSLVGAAVMLGVDDDIAGDALERDLGRRDRSFVDPGLYRALPDTPRLRIAHLDGDEVHSATVATYPPRKAALPHYTLTGDSSVIIRSRSSVHPIEWRARALAGFLEAELDSDTEVIQVNGHLEVSVRDLTSGNKAYDLQLPRTVHARKYPLVVAELNTLERRQEAFFAGGLVTFHGATIVSGAEVTLEVSGDRVRISGTTTLDLRSFGFSPPKVLGLQVFPEVEVDFSISGVPT